MTGPDAGDLAAERYAAGWALSGGPMTGRVRAGCAAAVSMAVSAPADPGLLEASLHLGHLEGVWASVYARQDALYATAAEGTAVAWRKLLHGLDYAAMVSALRSQAGMTGDGSPAPGTDSDSGPAAKYHKAEFRTLAAMLAAGLLAGIPSLPGFADLLAAIGAALSAAAAEGYASALAVAASQAGETGFAWDAAVQAGQAQEPPPGSAEALAAAIIAGCAADLAVILTGLAVAGAAAAAMTAAVRAYLRDPKALLAYLTHGMAGAISAAVRALYGEAGVTRLNWLDVGDERVCVTCSANAAGSPYDADVFPPLPAHFGCRCWAEAVPADMGRLRKFFARFLP